MSIEKDGTFPRTPADCYVTHLFLEKINALTKTLHTQQKKAFDKNPISVKIVKNSHSHNIDWRMHNV